MLSPFPHSTPPSLSSLFVLIFHLFIPMPLPSFRLILSSAAANKKQQPLDAAVLHLVPPPCQLFCAKYVRGCGGGKLSQVSPAAGGRGGPAEGGEATEALGEKEEKWDGCWAVCFMRGSFLRSLSYVHWYQRSLLFKLFFYIVYISSSLNSGAKIRLPWFSVLHYELFMKEIQRHIDCVRKGVQPNCSEQLWKPGHWATDWEKKEKKSGWYHLPRLNK